MVPCPGLEHAVQSGQIDLAIRVTDADGNVRPKAWGSGPVRTDLPPRIRAQPGGDGICPRLLSGDERHQLQQQAQPWGCGWCCQPLHPRGVTGTEAAVSLTTLIPLILILMTITGAVYPAIDLTAGERERGTLETLMAAPVPRLGLLAAKYVAV
jgi:sodium transport system permease protein